MMQRNRPILAIRLTPYSPEFRTQMQNVRDAVWNLLNDFTKEHTGTDIQQAVKTAEDKDAFTIFLGEVADTLRTPRKRVITELEKQGYKVVSGIPPPVEAAAHEQAVKDALENTQLAIHLLDQYPGREIAGDPENCYPQKQAELSLQSAKPKMIWVPAETDFTSIEDEKYKVFLQGLETGKASAKAYEFIRGSKSTLAQEIMDYAQQLKTRQMQKKAVNGKIIRTGRYSF